MAILENLEPKEVFHYFEEICNIPHGSGNTAEISNYLVEFAKKKGLEYQQDELGNVIMIKEATAGYEAAPPVMIQGHMDMVAVSDRDCDIDMRTEGLRLAVDGDQIYAKGTSLGADDGIAVAYALAVLSSDTLKHPRLEVVVTVEEEVGMEGASGIDLSMCRAKRLINLDSEEEGYLLAGCAGGASFLIDYPLQFQEYEGISCHLSISGLQGGHSGSEIHKGTANANLLMARVVHGLMKLDGVHLLKIDGGKKDNVIPNAACADLLIEKASYEKVSQEFLKWQKIIPGESKLRDPDVIMEFKSADGGPAPADFTQAETAVHKAVEDRCAKKLLSLIQTMPRGVCEMSPAVSGLVETSLNLGTLTMDEQAAILGYAVRSSVASKKEELLERMILLCDAYHAAWNIKGVYPGWEYQPQSPLRDAVCGLYQKMYGKEMVVQAIHAGLECGFFAEKIEGLDCISIGPDMRDVHTTKERLSISSTERVYRFLIRLLEELK
ncbi:MAG: beta-Ala-His dipeptidase [Lachnospiraceae bacterium]|nr:beta-Ala-His dipeptidase [Lachnospiraceae bacterium]